MSSSGMPMPAWDEKHLRAATQAAGVALWSWNVDTDAITMDEHAYDLWEVSKDEQKITFEILSRNIHPADLERVRSAFSATRAVVGAYEIDFRILSGSDIRWISARGQGDDANIAGRIMFGIFLDVTQRKQAEEANELLAGEMSHRVKNLLHIATALTQITGALGGDQRRHGARSDRTADGARTSPGARSSHARPEERVCASRRSHFRAACALRREGSQRSHSRLGAQDECGRDVEHGAGPGYP